MAADKGQAYAVYFPAGGEVGLDVSDAEGPLAAQWINIETGELGPARVAWWRQDHDFCSQRPELGRGDR